RGFWLGDRIPEAQASEAVNLRQSARDDDSAVNRAVDEGCICRRRASVMMICLINQDADVRREPSDERLQIDSRGNTAGGVVGIADVSQSSERPEVSQHCIEVVSIVLGDRNAGNLGASASRIVGD